MIEIAVVLSALVQHWPDFFIILTLLLANAVVGFWEEHQAGNAIAALKAKLAIEARVRRDGTWTTAPARELVPGDVIRVRLGDIVPADARLLEGDPIEVDQSALTGESLPVPRKPGEAVFSGSIVRQGEIDALVYATGANTYFGKTAQLVQEAQTVSHFQRAVLKIGNYLIVLAVALVAIIIAVAIVRGDPMLTTLQFALVLTVAAIPVAMPTVLSVTMAVGARLLAKRGSDREPAGGHRGAGRHGRALCRQDRHPDPEQADPGRAVQRRGRRGRRGHPAAPRWPRARRTRTPSTSRCSAAWPTTRPCRATRSSTSSPSTRSTSAPRPPSRAPDGKPFQVTKGAPQVILELVGRCRAGARGRRRGGQRVRGTRLPLPGCGAGRRQGDVAVPRRAAPVRPAPRRRQGDHRDRPTDGCEGQDGDRRCPGHRPGDRQEAGHGHGHPRCQRLRRRGAA